jgi:hypothetical protein
MMFAFKLLAQRRLKDPGLTLQAGSKCVRAGRAARTQDACVTAGAVGGKTSSLRLTRRGAEQARVAGRWPRSQCSAGAAPDLPSLTVQGPSSDSESLPVRFRSPGRVGPADSDRV